MSNVWFIGDIHAGHKNIQKFRGSCTSEEDNRKQIEEAWKERVKKRDLVWVLGDAAFTEEGLDWIGSLSGLKYLVRGNHDCLSTRRYLDVFEEVYGIVRYKKYWLTHAPIHPDELRGKVNLHGHVHYATIKVGSPTQPLNSIVDTRYLNCSVEGLRHEFGSPIVSLEQVRGVR